MLNTVVTFVTVKMQSRRKFSKIIPIIYSIYSM